LDIEPVDMVVVNLYPFKKMTREKIGFDQMLEYIDIGGSALLRAGAKNFKNIACISSVDQYKKIIEELKNNRGCITENTLRELACEVFRLTKEYDTSIYSYLKKKDLLIWDLEKTLNLRYGENPHQKGAVFRLVDKGHCNYTQLQGKQVSFNNLLDLDTAFSLSREFTEPAAVIIKHTSPCGVAIDKNICKAYLKAYGTDPLSSFGGIIGLNRKVDKKTAKEIIKSGFKECIIAPGYSKEAIKIFAEKKNLRIIEIDFSKKNSLWDIKKTAFGYLIQDVDDLDLDKRNLKIVTQKKPSSKELKDLFFAWKVAKCVKSNAIVIAKHCSTLGIGIGQPSRVDAVKIAIKKSLKSTANSVIASDAFFPKEDAIKLMKKNGIKAIIQPGGSIMDEKIISLCNKYHLSMVFTGIRHFRH
jgi:phosphoribosylaminoimidazolecarboxamide formyltransferase/IMP cyclohydrolase